MTIRFAAAPGQNAVGLVAAAQGERLFAVVIEPKLWCAEPRQLRVEWPAHEETLVLRLFEGDVAVVHLPDEVGSDARRAAVEAALGHEPAPAAKGGAADEPPERSDARLLAELPARGSAGEPVAADAAPFAGIIGLLRRADASGRCVAARFDATATDSLRPLRPLLHLAFLQAIEAQAHDIRRGYVPVTASLGAVRGRLLGDGLVRHVACREMRLACRFDALTEATPLFRVLVTALRCVASDGLPGGPFGQERVFRDLGVRSGVLLQQLSAVRPLARGEAPRVLSSIRLNRFERRWQHALDLARLVLRAEALAPRPRSTARSTAFSLKIVTPTFWEEVLRASLPFAAGGDVALVPRTAAVSRPPWAGLGGTSRPDIMVAVGSLVWCIDAKYKRLAPEAQPSKADQYQLFAYSHLAGHRAPDLCVLAYPCRGAARQRRYVRNPAAAALPLVVLQLPFPSPAQVRTEACWHAYLEARGRELRALTDEVNAPQRAA